MLKKIYKILHEFSLDRREVLHRNDADSVSAWIQRTKDEECSRKLVRFVKFQGETSSYNLRPDDFMLILLSDAQLIGAQQFCGPKKEVCMDSTHGYESVMSSS